MRLHHLTATAFGPFAETIEVDFDALAAGGLFLLSGPTGAGKTSVLDAVCFALYGDVPGDRAGAKRLRCDQAAPGVRPQVVAEATLGGRRFKITRSPAWQRPKRRGDGVTTEQAAVSVSERVGGEWRPLTSRLDEAGQLISELLGMNLPQFAQVAMLPQGRFQAFLRARSEERHQLLQQLFRTGRFEDVERWLKERRLDLKRRGDEHREALAIVVARVSEVDDEAIPDDWDVNDLGLQVGASAITPWSRDLRASSSTRLAAATERTAAAAAAEAQARALLDQAHAEAAHRRAWLAACTAAQRMEAQRPAAQARKDRLMLARRSAVVHPLLRSHADAAAAHAQAEIRRVRARAALPGDLADSADRSAGLVAERAAAVADLATLRALIPRERRRDDVTHLIEVTQTRLAENTEQVSSVTARLAQLPDLLDVAARDAEAARDAASAFAALEQQRSALQIRVAAAAEAELLEASLGVARVEWIDARERTANAHESLLGVREARINGMAAELAAGLVAGCSCPVCGSASHPQRAATAPGAPDEAAEREAQRALDDAKSDEHLRDQHRRDLEVSLARLRERAGDTTTLDVECSDNAAEIAAVSAVASLLPERESAVTQLTADLDDARVRAAELRGDQRELTAHLELLVAEQTAIAADVQPLLRRHGAESLAAAAERLHQRVELLDAAVRSSEEAAHAAAQLDDAQQRLAEQLAAEGFTDRGAALQAHLDDDDQRRLEAQVTSDVEQAAAVEAELERLRANGGAVEPGTPEPELASLERAHEQAAAELELAREEAAVATRRAERLISLLAEAESVSSVWRPVITEHQITARLSAFVEGKSADNQWQMRLSAYVLAYRLSQVVAAANERLARMSDQRYRLEHVIQRGVGETRGGLSLQIRDDWSGISRDPATLSGGETFVVSLALALGLADVVCAETGGAQLDTLFVDEGFGALDADTLDDVMDTLDSLRDGGRVVGVVSHVAQMRDRIPTQLLVHASRTGSTVSLRHGHPDMVTPTMES